MQIETALTTKPETNLAMFQSEETTVDFDPTDILISKILLMQSTSPWVAEGKFAQGDIVNPVTLVKLGDKAKGINFAPLSTFKTMTVLVSKEGRNVVDHVEPWGAQHVGAPWDYEKDGKKYGNRPTLNFYAMLEEDLKKPSSMPVILSFRSQSLRAGKKIINFFAQAADIQKKPCAMMLTLNSLLTKNDKGVFHVFDVLFSKDTPMEYGPKLIRWEKLLKTAKVVVDTTGDEKEVEADVVDTKVTSSSQF